MSKINIPKEIATERLILRKHEIQDAARMFEAVDRNRSLFEKYLPWVKPTKTQQDSEDYIKTCDKNWVDSLGFDFSILVKESGAFVGNLGLHSIVWAHFRGEFGYWLDAQAQGNGYMLEAVRALEAVCFEAGFNRLEIRCAPSNLASAAVPKRLDYHLDGKLRSNFAIGGDFQDTLVFSKVKSDLTSR